MTLILSECVVDVVCCCLFDYGVVLLCVDCLFAVWIFSTSAQQNTICSTHHVRILIVGCWFACVVVLCLLFVCCHCVLCSESSVAVGCIPQKLYVPVF